MGQLSGAEWNSPFSITVQGYLNPGDEDLSLGEKDIDLSTSFIKLTFSFVHTN